MYRTMKPLVLVVAIALVLPLGCGGNPGGGEGGTLQGLESLEGERASMSSSENDAMICEPHDRPSPTEKNIRAFVPDSCCELNAFDWIVATGWKEHTDPRTDDYFVAKAEVLTMGMSHKCTTSLVILEDDLHYYWDKLSKYHTFFQVQEYDGMIRCDNLQPPLESLGRVVDEIFPVVIDP